MSKNRIQHAVDSCLSELQFTQADRRAILAKAKKKQKLPRIGYAGFASAVVMAAALFIVFMVRAPKPDMVAIVATNGGGEVAIATYTPAPSVTPIETENETQDETVEATVIPTIEPTPEPTEKLELLNELEATEIAKNLLISEQAADSKAIEAFAYSAAALEDADGSAMFMISVMERDTNATTGTEAFRVSVNRETGDALIVYRKPVSAQYEDLSEQELAQQELTAYEAEATAQYGLKRSWPLEVRAKWSEYAKASGMVADVWDTLPGDDDISADVARTSALEKLKKTYTDLDVDNLTCYTYFREDGKGQTTWYFEFLNNADDLRGYTAEVNSKAAQPVEQWDRSLEQFGQTQGTAYSDYYYNPIGGTKYHTDMHCYSVSHMYLPLSPITDGMTFDALTPCPYCTGE